MGGAKPGNTNALKNGSKAYRLTVGKLPPKLSRVQRYVWKYRRELENVTFVVHGEVRAMAAHLIDAACQHEQHRQVCRWLLRERLDTMSINDIRECSHHMCKAVDSRNKAVEALALDETEGVFNALYFKPETRKLENGEDEDDEET